MKKVLLTKSQQIRVTTPDILKKPQNGVTTPPPNHATALRVTQVQTNVITNTYMQRKSFQSIYEEIFKLLMRLPDKALQQRVIDAINGRVDKNPNQCKYCSNNQKPLKVSASTQTDILLETKETKGYFEILKQTSVKSESPVKKECDAVAAASVDSTSTKEQTEPAAKVPRKRGRKRNTCVPQVVKRSAAQMALQEREDKQLTPLPPVKKKKPDTIAPSPSASPNLNSTQRRDSVASNLSFLSDYSLGEVCNEMENYIALGSQNSITAIMSAEFSRADNMSEQGLLPIHNSILDGNVLGLQRQMFVWRELKVDLNTLLTRDGEDCLEIAITSDSEPEIVKIILAAGLLPNHIYENANTVLHLAVVNNIQLESLRELMQRIDLNLLLQTNDDGYTALHIAVRHNRYRMAEIICDTIDQRLLGEPVYRRTIDLEDASKATNKTMEAKEEKKFAKFYEKACDRLEHNKNKLLSCRLKQEALNATEARAGNGSLFYAVEGELEHFCYFMLAHLSDPDQENLSGHSPKSFHYEFARFLRINLKVARIMDKVIGLLNGKTS